MSSQSLPRVRSTKPRAIPFARQRHLLLLLDALGGRVGNLDFQKLLFLYCQEPPAADAYEFVPYKFGAFSFTSYADRSKLVERGFLSGEATDWQLTSEGKRVIGETPDLLLSEFERKTRALRGDALVAETYRRFPYYAIRSEITERVLRGDAPALERVKSARATGRTPCLSTIGYEGRSLESYINELLKAGVSLLCDVRRNPISRKYGFSKGTLSRACESVGIRYDHLPELGIASEHRQNLETQADYDALFSTYETASLPLQQKVLARIVELIRSGERVTLTCYERLPQHCHRRCVADSLERLFGTPLSVRHL